MRVALLGTVLALIGFPALAASVEDIKAFERVNDSVLEISCATCADSSSISKDAYTVPVLGKGVQRVELHETDDGPMAVRVEAWLGGSPVRLISRTQGQITTEMAKALEEAEEKRLAEEERLRNLPQEIDPAATAAVNAGEEPAAPVAASFDPDALDLRIAK